MALSLTRRLTQAALIVAAGVVPVIGTAGTASAAPPAPHPDPAAGRIDTGHLGQEPQHGAHEVGQGAGAAAGEVVSHGAPAVSHGAPVGGNPAAVVGQATRRTVGPAASQADVVTGVTAAATGELAGAVGQSLAGKPHVPVSVGIPEAGKEVAKAAHGVVQAAEQEAAHVGVTAPEKPSPQAALGAVAQQVTAAAG